MTGRDGPRLVLVSEQGRAFLDPSGLAAPGMVGGACVPWPDVRSRGRARRPGAVLPIKVPGSRELSHPTDPVSLSSSSCRWPSSRSGSPGSRTTGVRPGPDAGLTPSGETALSVFGDKLAAASAAARAAGRDPALGRSLQSGDAEAAQSGGRPPRAPARRYRAVGPNAPGCKLASVGETGAPGAAGVAVRGPGGLLGHVRALTLRPHRYVEQVSRLTGSEVALLLGGGSSRPAPSSPAPTFPMVRARPTSSCPPGTPWR